MHRIDAYCRIEVTEAWWKSRNVLRTGGQREVAEFVSETVTAVQPCPPENGFVSEYARLFLHRLSILLSFPCPRV